MHVLWQDVKYAWRLFARRRALTAMALVCVALGVGANAAMFSLVYTALLRPLPFSEPDRLVVIRGASLAPRSARNYDPVLWMAHTGVFDPTAVINSGGVNLAGGSTAERITAAEVSATFFDVLRVAPALGRPLRWEDEPSGSRAVAVVSDGLWRRRFGGDAGLVGRMLSLNGMKYEVIGVMPRGFEFPAGSDVWIARVMPRQAPGRAQVGPSELRDDPLAFRNGMIARLRDGVSRGHAEAAVRLLQNRENDEGRRQMGPRAGVGLPPVVLSLHETLVRNVKAALLTLFGAVGLVLLIACANLANLLLASTAARRRELALRAAIGASRSRVVRQVLTESVVLAGAGGGLGVLLAWAAMPLIRHWTPGSIPGAASLAIDPWVIGFAAAIAVLAGMLAGLVPAWRSAGVDPQPHLADDAGTTGWRSGRLRSSLVVAEVALAVILVSGATSLMRSFSRLMHVPPGFEISHRLTFEVSIPFERYREQTAAMYQDLLDRLAALPGTEGVAMVDDLPLGQGTTTYQWPDIEGRPTALQATANTRRVTRGYFGVMGIPMLRGRAFTEDEERDGTRAVIVNDELARQGWPGEDPIGKRITFGAIRSAPVVGVVASVQHLSLGARRELQMYVPGLSRSPSSAVVIRTKGDPLAIARDVRAVVAAVDVNLPVTRLRTFEDVVSASAAAPRFRTSVLAIFAGLALLLAVAGIYGVLSYLVALRTREIGVRMALGASAGAVVRMVMRQALPLVLLGAVLGSGGAFILGRTLRAFLYGMEPTDTVSLAVSVSLIVGAAFIACAVPARRASRVDPVVALRVE